MQDKQKVTLYLPPELHRQLKIRAAVDSEPMSAIAERAIEFYMTHSEAIEELESSYYGRTHQVYNCPDCASSVVIRDGELVSLGNRPSIIADDELPVDKVETVKSKNDQQGEEQLVPC
ncbi:hypothetical protein [Oxynema aestuarii]|jgi:hypothetical protein|uniref:Uncharacterized protein n=1 Tax=Oxynema aestuarii AP17 TaxID=2064643 RepID=A0A6H1TU68_9CYAN|nr:hypothetical protein [Oxynema aestuarii]QIZ69303.1 hypothetical protein HCG48_00785 [Oxynema aestuarii AP17]RMH75611.1 MAG: hypothetical protein D6680_11210 [Cyanobacteria bacterium J007]